MNNILSLQGKFETAPNPQEFGPLTIPKDTVITPGAVESLLTSLEGVYRFWNKPSHLFKPLVSVHYKDIVAKSNRMRKILGSGSESPSKTIVGATFSEHKILHHVMTHCVSLEVIAAGLDRLAKTSRIIADEFGGSLSSDDMLVLNNNTKKLKRPLTQAENEKRQNWEIAIQRHGLSRSEFSMLLRDIVYIDYFSVEQVDRLSKEKSIVTLYDTGIPSELVLSKLEIQRDQIIIIDPLTWMVTPGQYNKIVSLAPYLVAMTVTDMGRVGPPSTYEYQKIPGKLTIPAPTNEPVIGVLDTLFDESVYFSSWVTNKTILSPDLIDDEDFHHGTAVSSIIVDGPTLNPALDDGCGRFRVKHFGIASGKKNSSSTIMKNIRSIISSNLEVKVWNLCLGSMLEVEEHLMSVEGATLDALMTEFDVIFVVSGTNNDDSKKDLTRLGSPADSLNSLVVTSSTIGDDRVAYARRGPVLHFFNKPDVATFGGDSQDRISAYSNTGWSKVSGTSFAAPWISRKLAYLIHICGFSREVAKALIIDAAAKWDQNNQLLHTLGHGVVPRHINDILNTPNDEIRFTLQGVTNTYETYSYRIPVPLKEGKFPYFARVCLCYFPKCSRIQGVDYTNTELDIKFGRLDAKGKIKAIDHNTQGDDKAQGLFEKHVRQFYRKWDNVKLVREYINPRGRARAQINKLNPHWGISIKRKERLNDGSGKGMHFGVVVTLRAQDKKNRIDEFIQRCAASGWIVTKVNVQAMVDVYQKADETIVFSED